MAENWYTVNTKPNKESQVNAYLSSQGVLTYYPTLEVKPVNPRAAKLRPYFPGYIFVRVALEEVGISTLKWIPGAIGVVQFGGQPAVLGDQVIEEMQERIKSLDLRHTGRTTFRPGDKVLVQNGVFAGWEAIFDTQCSGDERVQVLVRFLGRTVKARVDMRFIEKQR